MKLRNVLTEAEYPGNIGAMEVFHFYKQASPEEKETFAAHLSKKEYKQGWDLIQDVTGTTLHTKENKQP